MRRPALRRRRRTVGPRLDPVGRTRPFELVSPGFVEVLEEPGRRDGLTRSSWSPPAPYVGIEVNVTGGGQTLLAGLATGDGDHLVGFLDPSSGEAGIEIRTRGLTSVLARRRVRGRPRRMAFVVCENQPTLLLDTGRGWHPVATDRQRVAPRLDLRVPDTLARFTVAYGSRGGASESGAVRAGLFGMAGLRDLHLVQEADGTPYSRDGRLFLTATCAGLGFFQQAHWGVFAVDPDDLTAGDPLRLEQTAHLFFHRDGLVLGDHAGQLVRDGDRWLLAVSSWGDFAPHRGPFVRHTSTTDDLLAGVHVLETERTPMPTDRGCYDPGMTRIGGRWHVSYVESVSHRPSTFHPALAVGPAGAHDWTEELERVGEADGLAFCEGPVLGRPEGADGEWRLMASDGRARRYPVFDLGMRRVGDLDAHYGSNLPHPQLLDLPGGSRVMLTFDGTQYAQRVLGYGAHGDVLVLRTQSATPTPP